MTKEEIIDFCEMKSQLEPENEDIFKNIIKALEKEPCKDAVSRQEALNLFNNSDEYGWEMSLLKKKIKDLPPVKPIACIAEISFSKEDMQKIVNEKIKEITAELEEMKDIRKWIPCNERLPKESGFYLVSTTDCITIMEFCKGWISQNIGSCNWYVKAWQPLPKPYKVEKESEE